MKVYKHAFNKHLKREVIVELELLANSFIYFGTGGGGKIGKCRASRAKVIAITDKTGKVLPVTSAHSSVHKSAGMKYTVGLLATPLLPFDKTETECSSGIHFYLTREEAARIGGVK